MTMFYRSLYTDRYTDTHQLDDNILQVIVQDGEVVAGVDEEGVGAAGVVDVVYGRRYQAGYLVQLVEDLLNSQTE